MTPPPTTRFRCEAARPSGATDVRVIHAASPAAARDRLIAAGLEPLAIEAVGPSLLTRLSEALRNRARRQPEKHAFLEPARAAVVRAAPRFLASVLLLSLAGTSFAVMIGSWSLALVTGWKAERIIGREAVSLVRYHERLASERVRRVAAPVMTAPAVTEVMERLAGILPPDTGLAEAKRDAAGVLTVVLETSDPDQIRPVLARDPLFGSMRDIGQARTDQGTIRMTLTDAEQ